MHYEYRLVSTAQSVSRQHVLAGARVAGWDLLQNAQGDFTSRLCMI